jgi:hypothetical protein
MKRAAIIALAVAAIGAPALAQPIIQFDFGPPPPHGSFWEGAPPTLGERIAIARHRLDQLHRMGVIAGGEWDQDNNELIHITILHDELNAFEGGHLSQGQYNWLWGRLDALAHRMHWQASMGF